MKNTYHPMDHTYDHPQTNWVEKSNPTNNTMMQEIIGIGQTCAK